MEKKKRFSILKALITAICIVFVVLSIVVNILFSNGKVPKIFDRYVYIVDENAKLGSYVTPGEALITKEAKDVTFAKGDIVLCYPAEDPDNLRIRSINDIVVSETGEEKYTTSDEAHVDNTGTITRDKIIAIASGYTQSMELGKFITFTISVKGILLELILPSVILVIFLIAGIVSAKNRDEEEEEFGFYEYDEEEKKNEAGKKSHAKTGAPLFEASQEIQPSDEFERKKMSIAENFSQKKVNPDSPYQKEKERTMQFKAQRSAESSFAARNMGGQSSTAPTADALREEMLRKTAEAERTGSYNIKTSSISEEAKNKITDNTGVLSKAQLAEMSRNDVPKTTPLRSQSAPSVGVQKKSSSPDITDIIKKSDNSMRKKSASDMSVDDLLRLIEDEKKKL